MLAIYSKPCDICGKDFQFKWEGVGVFLSEICLNCLEELKIEVRED